MDCSATTTTSIPSFLPSSSAIAQDADLGSAAIDWSTAPSTMGTSSTTALASSTVKSIVRPADDTGMDEQSLGSTGTGTSSDLASRIPESWASSPSTANGNGQAQQTLSNGIPSSSVSPTSQSQTAGSSSNVNPGMARASGQQQNNAATTPRRTILQNSASAPSVGGSGAAGASGASGSNDATASGPGLAGVLRASTTMPASRASSSSSTSPSSAIQQQAQTQMSPSSSFLPGDGAGETEAGTVVVDPQIIEALKSKDRLYVLKLGEIMEGLIKEGRAKAELTPSTSYQRLLVHRCSGYYKLTPESDTGTKSIYVHLNTDSRVPPRRLCELVPAESTSLPAFKIMRRAPSERKPHSTAGSAAGEDQDLSDVEPSEAGSLSSRGHHPHSNGSGGGRKKRLTIEEREAAYNQARSRIFMDFVEKEKDMSASSSTLSLVSGSASTTGSSICDFDESVGTPGTESEWSGPAASRMSGAGSTGGSVASSSRSLRSSAPAFSVGTNGSGGGSSMSSRAPSPSFSYPSLYEPPPTGYDGSQGPGPHPGAYMQPYYYPYGHPPPHHAGQPHHYNPYAAYTYYPYPYPPQNHSDPGTPMMPSEAYYEPQQPPPPPHQMVGVNQHYWPPPGPQQQQQIPPSSSAGQTPQQQQQQPGHQPHPPMQHSSPGPGAPQGLAMPVHQHPAHGGYGYPPAYMPYGMYYPPMQHPTPDDGSMSPPHMGHPPLHPPYEPRRLWTPNDGSSQSSSASNSRGGSTSHLPASASGSSSTSSSSKRGGPPSRNAHWSYGPGVGGNSGGRYHKHNQSGPDDMNPRLNQGMRRPSANSLASSTSNTRSDEASSNASQSSSTSSSSRRTYTSTASSQHPLPARPDWAVGIKAQATLHSSASRHSNTDRSNTASDGQHQPSLIANTADFPPLTQDSSKKPVATVAAGAWNNSSSAARLPPGGNNGQNGVPAAPVNGANNFRAAIGPSHEGKGAGAAQVQPDEHDRGYERPPLRGPVDLYNPKSNAAAGARGNQAQARNGRQAAESTAAIGAQQHQQVVARMQTLSLNGPV